MTLEWMEERVKDQLIADARDFYRHGWLLGTSGNLSARLDPKTFLITTSGLDKGRLSSADFTTCDLEGQACDSGARRPSAETGVHAAIYRRLPSVGAIYHVHQIHAALCSDRDSGRTEFREVEMIKGLDIWEEGVAAAVPIVENFSDLEMLSTAVEAVVERVTSTNMESGVRWAPAVNIRRHGFYAWGATTFEAKRHVETLAYLYHYSWQISRRGAPVDDRELQ
jgi:methylthioribulose-1-phosphate dehydratase